MKRWLVVIGAVLILVLVIGGIKGYGVFKMVQGFKSQGIPKQTVSTLVAASQDWESQLSAVGTVRAVRGADLSAEVAGIVDAIQFESGDEVKAGQALLRLRDADDVAKLDSLKASAALARINYERDKQELDAQAISQATVDSDLATLKSANAQVAEQQALVDKKLIRAPFAGHLGIRAVDLGQYLGAGVKIVTLQALDPIYVDFSLPQQALAQLHIHQAVSASGEGFPGESFAGEITAIDPKIDVDTRNVLVRATLGNAKRELLPGMFVNVGITVGTPLRYITLPQTAVSFNPYGQTVYIVTPAGSPSAAPTAPGAAARAPPPQNSPPPPAIPADTDTSNLVAHQIFVTTGATRGDQVAIIKGVNEGDQVVTSGQIKLKNGSLVIINNSVQPTDDANPAPQEK